MPRLVITIERESIGGQNSQLKVELKLDRS